MRDNVKLDCRNIWKLYGNGSEQFLDGRKEKPSIEEVRAHGLVGAVRDATVEVLDGEIFVIMGLSGSGKSTLVRCMSRLIEATAGQVLLDGQDLLAANPQELIGIRRHRMGMVFQHFALLPHLTVLQNVSFPLDIQGVGVAEREDRARQVIELVGLQGREDNYPNELSGGQQQRVGIARSLAVEPELWFLDEPFSALDPLIRREMQDEFLRLQEMLNKTIVFITHDFDEAIRLADRIAIMQDGEIIQIATPEELVMSPATDYVREFTQHIPRAKVLTAGSLVSPGDPTVNPVKASQRVDEIAERVLESTNPISVEDADGGHIGIITRSSVLKALIGEQVAR